MSTLPSPSPRAFIGWRIVVLAIVTGALTGPGQTIGVSVFVDPFIDDLGLTRSSVSTAYLIGTLIAALGLPMVGAQIDRLGARRAMMAIGIGFGAALVAMSGVQGFTTLIVGFVAIRLLGQGSLTLVSTISVTHWFDRRRGTAMGIFATGTRVLMSLVPVGLSVAIVTLGWRTAWVIAGIVVWLVVLPIARFGIVDRPADIGQLPDGNVGELPDPTAADPTGAATRGEALRTARFWVLTASSMAIGMLSTALNFHQVSLLGDAGLTPVQAAVMFLPQVIGTAIAGVIFGYLADRLTGRILIPMVMALLAGALLFAANLTPGLVIIMYAICLGAAGGASSAVNATLLPRWFGLRHIGAIQGTASLLNVASTALGPLSFSIARDLAGNYEGAAAWFALMPVAAGVAAMFLTSATVVGIRDRG
jgi:MFS family permease